MSARSIRLRLEPVAGYHQEGKTMITLCICYTIDLHKTADFEQYARRWPEPIKRCGGDLVDMGCVAGACSERC